MQTIIQHLESLNNEEKRAATKIVGGHYGEQNRFSDFLKKRRKHAIEFEEVVASKEGRTLVVITDQEKKDLELIRQIRES